MFEEHITKNWICPVCGNVDKVRVVEVKRSVWERTLEYETDITLFELLRFERANLTVTCFKCGCECYKE